MKITFMADRVEKQNSKTMHCRHKNVKKETFNRKHMSNICLKYKWGRVCVQQMWSSQMNKNIILEYSYVQINIHAYSVNIKSQYRSDKTNVL